MPWLNARVSWPSLVYAEVAHALLRLCRARRIGLSRAQAVLDTLYAVPADVRPVESLARQAWVLALDRRLTVYDACYIVLAETLDASLVTADRRLAAATRNSVLITG